MNVMTKLYICTINVMKKWTDGKNDKHYYDDMDQQIENHDNNFDRKVKSGSLNLFFTISRHGIFSIILKMHKSH